MASLVGKRRGGRTDYYLVESARVAGKTEARMLGPEARAAPPSPEALDRGLRSARQELR